MTLYPSDKSLVPTELFPTFLNIFSAVLHSPIFKILLEPENIFSAVILPLCNIKLPVAVIFPETSNTLLTEL